MYRNWYPLVFALYCGLFLVLIVRTVVGPFGTIELTALTEKERDLVYNIRTLQEYQKVLDARVNRLQNNSEAQRLLSRRLGYYRPGERRIIIYDNPFPVRRLRVGSLLLWEARSRGRDVFCGWLLVAVSIFTYVFIVASGAKLR